MSRGRLLLALIAALALGVAAWWPRAATPPALPRAELRALRADLGRLAERWFDRDRLRRGDGYTYAVDVTQLMLHAAHVGRLDLYLRLRDFAARHLLLDDPADPYTQGFVVWRWRPDTPPDASGTTEALRLAAALWQGARRLHRPADAALAVRVLHGYARHAATDHGVWLVRNYFNLGTRAFANDSYLVDYDPDLLAEVAAATGDAALADVAARSYALVRAARAPSGLLHTLVQPDLRTMMPALEGVAFSPNDVIQLDNACTVAATVARGDPALARGVLRFARARLGHLRRWYLGRTGAPHGEPAADLTTLSCLARLAALLGDEETAQRVVARALPSWQYLPRDEEPRIYTAIEALLALDAVINDGGGGGPPAPGG